MQATHSGSFWEDKGVLVTGGAGFIGSHLSEYLINKGAKVTVLDNLKNGSRSNLPSSTEVITSDALNLQACEAACEDVDVVINAVAKVAGVGYNAQHHGEMFYKNAQLNLNMLEAARRKEVDRYVVISSACVYERTPPIPTPETYGFVGDPEETNFGYGWAKRLAEIQARTYVAEYGMKIAVARPYNTYGPRDHFESSDGHVIPSLIKKVYSGADAIPVWGNGAQRRSFVYVSDLVSGIALAAERCTDADPINIGSQEEISIADLIQTILILSGKKIRIDFDVSKPAGQLRRCPDLTKAKKILDYSPEVNIREGLRRTIEWYNASASHAQKQIPATVEVA